MDNVLLAVITTLTSILTAISGVGGGMILIGVMPLFLPNIAIIPVHGTTQLASCISRAWLGRNHIAWSAVRPYAVGSVFGIVIFGVLVRFISLELIPLFIGTYLLLSQWSSWINRRLSQFDNFYVIGFLQTGIGIFVGSAGAINMPKLMQQYPDNDTVVATAGTQVSMMHIGKIVVYFLLGFSFVDYWKLIILLIVASVFGSFIGVKIRNLISAQWLKKAFPWVLTVIAIKIIFSGLYDLGWLNF